MTTRVMLVMAAVLLLTGCSIMGTVQDSAKKVVDKVCEMSPAEREALRSTIDAATAPHKIRVECAL